MAFKHPSFLDIVAETGIPFMYIVTHDPPLHTFNTKQVVVVYHKDADFDYPTSAALGSAGINNVWGKFVFPKPVGRNHGIYIRVPKLDRAIMRQFEEARLMEMIKIGKVTKRVAANGDRIIDLEGLT